MFIDKLFKEKFPGISGAAADFLISTAPKAEFDAITSDRIDLVHVGRDALCQEDVINALSDVSDGFVEASCEEYGVLYGAIVAFRKSGHIPEEYTAYMIRQFLETTIRQFIEEPVAWF